MRTIALSLLLGGLLCGSEPYPVKPTPSPQEVLPDRATVERNRQAEYGLARELFIHHFCPTRGYESDEATERAAKDSIHMARIFINAWNEAH